MSDIIQCTFIHHCLLCKSAGKKHPGFVAPSVQSLLVDPSGQNALAKLISAFVQHLEKDHKEEFGRTHLEAAQFAGFLRLCYFEMPDPAAAHMRDWVRCNVAAKVRRYTVPDEKIVEQVTALGLPGEYLQRTIQMVRTMRDVLEERGPYAVPAPGSQAQAATDSSK